MYLRSFTALRGFRPFLMNQASSRPMSFFYSSSESEEEEWGGKNEWDSMGKDFRNEPFKIEVSPTGKVMYKMDDIPEYIELMRKMIT
jgi:hypothetical protein